MVRRDLRTGVETMAVPACELRVGDLVGPGCEVIEVRRHAEHRLLVRLSRGFSDLVPPGRSYWVAADRPEGPPALPPEEPERHRYVGWPPPSRWRTCQVCGQGANATIHRGPEVAPPARSEPETPWYCALCDTVVTKPGHRHSVACALGQDDIAHPYDPDHHNA